MIDEELKTKTYPELIADHKKYRAKLNSTSVTDSARFKRYSDIVKAIDKEMKLRDSKIPRNTRDVKKYSS